ncbi:MAG: Omp28 family outer membrane lipoprotein [Flavobacteriales bacterium]
MKKHILGSLFLGLTAALLLSSCDYVEEPYGTSFTGGGQTDTGQAVSRVLIEDFTGHRCGNCPRATERIDELQNLYGDRVVAIAVHVGFFASPTASGLFTADYRTPVGNELDQFYGNSVAGLPNGLVNRSLANGNAIIDVNAWAPKVVNLLTLPPRLRLSLQATFNTSNRQADASLQIQSLDNIQEQLRVVYYLTEDSVLGAQKDYSLSPSDIPEYYHRHMLRGSMNGTWGESLPSATLSNGQTINHARSFTIPNNWNQNKVAVVAVVYREDTREVIEVIEKKLSIQ